MRLICVDFDHAYLVEEQGSMLGLERDISCRVEVIMAKVFVWHVESLHLLARFVTLRQLLRVIPDGCKSLH